MIRWYHSNLFRDHLILGSPTFYANYCQFIISHPLSEFNPNKVSVDVGTSIWPILWSNSSGIAVVLFTENHLDRHCFSRSNLPSALRIGLSTTISPSAPLLILYHQWADLEWWAFSSTRSYEGLRLTKILGPTLLVIGKPKSLIRRPSTPLNIPFLLYKRRSVDRHRMLPLRTCNSSPRIENWICCARFALSASEWKISDLVARIYLNV